VRLPGQRTCAPTTDGGRVTQPRRRRIHPCRGCLTTVGTSPGVRCLADRYRTQEHSTTDARGRSVWRGIDVILPPAGRDRAAAPRRPERRGDVTAARRVPAAHPSAHVDVYDAFDEGARAYVVREWVDGTSLRELVADGPIDSRPARPPWHTPWAPARSPSPRGRAGLRPCAGRPLGRAPQVRATAPTARKIGRRPGAPERYWPPPRPGAPPARRAGRPTARAW